MQKIMCLILLLGVVGCKSNNVVKTEPKKLRFHELPQNKRYNDCELKSDIEMVCKAKARNDEVRYAEDTFIFREWGNPTGTVMRSIVDTVLLKYKTDYLLSVYIDSDMYKVTYSKIGQRRCLIAAYQNTVIRSTSKWPYNPRNGEGDRHFEFLLAVMPGQKNVIEVGFTECKSEHDPININGVFLDAR